MDSGSAAAAHGSVARGERSFVETLRWWDACTLHDTEGACFAPAPQAAIPLRLNAPAPARPPWGMVWPALDREHADHWRRITRNS